MNTLAKVIGKKEKSKEERILLYLDLFSTLEKWGTDIVMIKEDFEVNFPRATEAIRLGKDDLLPSKKNVINLLFATIQKEKIYQVKVQRNFILVENNKIMESEYWFKGLDLIYLVSIFSEDILYCTVKGTKNERKTRNEKIYFEKNFENGYITIKICYFHIGEITLSAFTQN